MSLVIPLIEKDKGQEDVEQSISQLIQADPSDYVSHEVYSIKVGSTTWYTTLLRMNKLTKSEALDSELQKITSARKKEGLLVLGSDPNFNDGRPRIVYLVVKREQLQYSHLEASRNSLSYSSHERQKRVSIMPCLRVGKRRIHLEYGFLKKAAAEVYEKEYSESSTILDQTSPGTIRGRMDIVDRSDTHQDRLHIILPNQSINDRFLLNFRRFKPGWCQCLLAVKLTRVKITLVETTTCVMPIEHKYVYESIQRRVFFDKSFKDVWVNSKSWRTLFYLDYPSYACDLPELGATIYSNKFCRTYALEFLVSLECPQGCTSTFTALTRITVPEEEDTKYNIDRERLCKKQDYVFLERFPRSGSAIQDINQCILNKVASLNSDKTLTYHSSVIGYPDRLVAVIVMSRYGPAENRGRIEKEAIVGEFNLKSTDFTDIVMFDSGCRLISSNCKDNMAVSDFLSLCESSDLRDYRPFGDNFWAEICTTKILSPGGFGCGWSIVIHLAKKSKKVYLKRLSIEVVEEIQAFDGERFASERKVNLVEDRHFKGSTGKLSLKEGKVTIPEEFWKSKTFSLKSTIFGRAFLRQSRVVVKLQLASFMAATEYIVAEEVVNVAGDYESLYSEPTEPPAYESGAMKEVEDSKD